MIIVITRQFIRHHNVAVVIARPNDVETCLSRKCKISVVTVGNREFVGLELIVEYIDFVLYLNSTPTRSQHHNRTEVSIITK